MAGNWRNNHYLQEGIWWLLKAPAKTKAGFPCMPTCKGWQQQGTVFTALKVQSFSSRRRKPAKTIVSCLNKATDTQPNSKSLMDRRFKTWKANPVTFLWTSHRACPVLDFSKSIICFVVCNHMEVLMCIHSSGRLAAPHTTIRLLDE